MTITAKEQAANAIRWIDTLPSYKQAPWGKRSELGRKEDGFCCLGAGCDSLGVNYSYNGNFNAYFSFIVGLTTIGGVFKDDNSFYGECSLDGVNDETKAGFKRIAKLLKTKPHWMFTPEVAALIKEHYA